MDSSAATAEHASDDDVLSSIRDVRQMMEQEFGYALRRRKQRTSIDHKGKVTIEEIDDKVEDSLDVLAKENDETWKDQCFRLKQELFEAKNQQKALFQKHKNELVEASSKIKEALTEACLFKEMKDTLAETLEAQRKQSEGLSKQLLQSRKNSVALEVMWKDLVQTMEEEKESMDKERETSLQLLEETQKRLASSLAEQERIEKEASEKNEKLAKKIEELQSTEKSFVVSLAQDTTNSDGTKETPPHYWNKSKTRSTLQYKLRELEESLSKDAEAIQLLEKQITTMPRNPKKGTELIKPKAKLSRVSNTASSATMNTASCMLATKKCQLRSKSLSVLEDVIQLQLQRLMEIHSQKTSGTNNDEEWKSILEKVSKNRAKVCDLRKDIIEDESDAEGVSSRVTDKNKRVGDDRARVNEGSPAKKSKTKINQP